MNKNLKEINGSKNTVSNDLAAEPGRPPLEVELKELKALAEFEDSFNKLYTTSLLKKLRHLNKELKDQYVFKGEFADISKTTNVKEISITIKSKASNSACMLSFILFLNKGEFSIQGVPLYSNPKQLYNKTALIPFIGKLEEFDPEKFEGYIFQILNYCFH